MSLAVTLRNWVKVNFDASILKASRLVGNGVVIKNDEGAFFVALCKNFSIQTDPGGN